MPSKPPTLTMDSHSIADTEHHMTIMINGCNLVFSEGFLYTFSQPELLKEALTVKWAPNGTQQMPTFNHRLAKLGDSAMKTSMLGIWHANDHPMDIWENLHDRGLGMGKYLAHMADETEFWKHCEINGNSVLEAPADATYFNDPVGYTIAWSSDWGVKCKKTPVEALFGAVWQDSEESCKQLRQVMRRMGVFWPENAVQGTTLARYIGQMRLDGELDTKRDERMRR